MKKVMRKYLYVLTAAMSTAILFSCSKEVDVINTNDSTEPGKTVTLTITASHDNGTRTYLDGDSVKWSESNETLAVFEENGTDVAKSTSKAGVTTDGGTTMTFATQLATATGSVFTYYAFYPSSAWNNNNSNKTPTSIAINTPSTQTPSATSFDPAADLLIAKPVETTSQATSLSMRFARAIAVGKMTIKNLQSSEKVIQVKFSAKNGSNDVVVAGRTPFDLGTAEPADVYGKNVSEKSIILDYNGLDLAADSSMDAFFTCYPFELGSGDSFTVEVQTSTNTFVRTVTIPESRSLAFKAGELSTFSVDMGSISGTANAVNLCYAYLTAEEFHEAGGTSSYSNVTVEKEHGDKWETHATYNSSSIGIRRNDNGTNDSYVKLPDFMNDISTVIVTLGSAMAADKTLTLESSKTDNTGSIASLTTVANHTTYTFDLSGTSVKTAYLRSSGAQALVSKIEVFAGTDTRSATQAGPSSVSAAVDAESPNTINVTWTTASGATGYEVTLTPDEGEAITQNVASTETSASFTGLEFNTSYTPSVVALADLYLSKANSSPVEGSLITTGAPNSGQTLENPYTVAEALEVIDALEDNATTPDDVYVSGTISQLDSYFSTYKSITYFISDGGTEASELEVYSGKGLNGADFNSLADLAVGDVVVVKGKLKKHVNNAGTVTTPEFDKTSEIVSIEKVTRYTVTLQTPEHGSILTPTTSVASGGTVILTATPSAGYEFDFWTVKDASNSDVVVTDNTFVMPASDVTVSASFKKMSGSVAIYTVTSTSAVETTGTAPEGSSVAYSSTYSSKCQLINGNSMTLTLSGFAGKKITGLVLSMKSNKSSGAGYLSMVSGSTTLASIGSSSSGVAFNNASWNGSYSTEYVDVTVPVTATTVGTNESVVITIGATVNSLYCQEFRIIYE